MLSKVWNPYLTSTVYLLCYIPIVLYVNKHVYINFNIDHCLQLDNNWHLQVLSIKQVIC